MEESSKAWVYVLEDVDQNVYYVGCTTNVNQRRLAHKAKRGKVSQIKKRFGVDVQLKVIEECEIKNRFSSEAEWYERLSGQGHNLLQVGIIPSDSILGRLP